ncbi:MAG TPA: hypothetical protein VD866_28840 [Urbifossiella sp.]|nr:hypothetical protein [Urbifossiella sp.]
MATDRALPDGLIRRVLDGDMQAVGEFYTRFRPVILSRIRRWLRGLDARMRRVFDSLEVYHLAMASFIRVLTTDKVEATEAGQAVNLFLAITDNKMRTLARDHLTRKKRNIRQADSLGPGHDSALADRGPSPTAIITNRDLWEAIRSRLSDDERAVAERRAAGEEWEAIAQSLGIQANAAGRRLARALERVLAELRLTTRDVFGGGTDLSARPPNGDSPG